MKPLVGGVARPYNVSICVVLNRCGAAVTQATATSGRPRRIKGWDKHRRVHGIVFHLRIRDGKIWVEDDWTEDGVAGELLDAGISHEEIVLGFHSAEKRPYTEFAVA